MDIERLLIIAPNSFTIGGFYAEYIISRWQIAVSNASFVLHVGPIFIYAIELVGILHVLRSAEFEGAVFDREYGLCMLEFHIWAVADIVVDGPSSRGSFTHYEQFCKANLGCFNSVR